VIEVGEYIRTKEGKIGKIINITISDKGIKLYSIKWDIIKYRDIKTHSKNIIDLIEIGDFVNEPRVMAVSNISGWVDTKEDVIYKDNIKTILTHEIYEREAYKIVIR
jgi:hypothetical protein